MLNRILGLAARLPLRWHHALGALCGWLSYLLSPTYAARIREHLRQSNICKEESEFRTLLRESIAHAGRGLAELIVVWFRPVEQVRKLVTQCDTLHVLEEAEQNGRGIIFITPHLGCFEITALFLAQRRPLTVLYRPPKKTWLRHITLSCRVRGGVAVAPTDLHGVRLLFKALRRGDSIGILPDQAPGAGEGTWVDFFGRPAYTMTLVGRLAESTGAPVIITCAERLPAGQGFRLHFERLMPPPIGSDGPRQLNVAIERIVRRAPAQYLWSYNRFKAPPGVAPPET
jgi:Kdo2-lipid IVA lauroyltransferase/acyltransferase